MEYCSGNIGAYILRIWWPKIISNKDLWRATGQEDINLEIRKRKFRWIGHTLRKENGEVPKAALLWNAQGSRKRGRPKTRWRRSVTKEVGRSWNELRFLAADRHKWKELIDNVCSKTNNGLYYIIRTIKLKSQWVKILYKSLKECVCIVGCI